MKKLLTFCGLLIALSAFTVSAQSAYMVSQTNGTTLDTVTNTGVRLQKVPVAGFQNVVSIQTLLVSKTGTPAGVVRLYGSNDGVKFVRIPTITKTGTIAIDSLTVDANTLSKIWIIPTHAYTYYQAGFTGSGTESTTMQNYAIWRRQP
jgi:hypothetical protein